MIMSIEGIKNLIHRGQKGQNLIEFAIVLPVLMLILMGVIDFGYMLKMQTDLTRANATGARTAAFRATDQEVSDSILNAMPSSFESDRLSVSLTRSTTTTERGAQITVTTEYIYESITPLPLVSSILDDMALGATTTVRIE